MYSVFTVHCSFETKSDDCLGTGESSSQEVLHCDCRRCRPYSASNYYRRRRLTLTCSSAGTLKTKRNRKLSFVMLSDAIWVLFLITHEICGSYWGLFSDWITFGDYANGWSLMSSFWRQLFRGLYSITCVLCWIFSVYFIIIYRVVLNESKLQLIWNSRWYIVKLWKMIAILWVNLPDGTFLRRFLSQKRYVNGVAC